MAEIKVEEVRVELEDGGAVIFAKPNYQLALDVRKVFTLRETTQSKDATGTERASAYFEMLAFFYEFLGRHVIRFEGLNYKERPITIDRIPELPDDIVNGLITKYIKIYTEKSGLSSQDDPEKKTLPTE